MELEDAILERVGNWESLSRWEKSELGKDLRRLGLSYGEIMKLVPVKKSTLATWCRDIELTDEQIAAIKKRRAPEPGLGSRGTRNANATVRSNSSELRRNLKPSTSLTTPSGSRVSPCTGARVLSQ